MRWLLLFLVFWMGCLDGIAQVNPSKPIGRWSPPIVIERIYASLGDPTAVLDTSRLWKHVHSAHPSSHAHFHLVFAAPTYLYAFSLNSPQLHRLAGFAMVDGNQVVDIHPNGFTMLERVVSTLDLHVQFNTATLPASLADAPLKNPLTTFWRDGLASHFFQLQAVDLGQVAKLYLYGEDKFLNGVQYPLALPGRVLASSSEEPATRYHPTFLFDGRDDFGWGTDHGQDGAGESIAMSLDRPLRVSRLKIWNGQQGSDSAFRRHPCARTLLLSTGMDAPQRLVLPDRNGPVVVELPQPLTSATFQLAVESVYPGQGSDVLVISELQLGNDTQWYSLSPDREAQLNTFNRAKTKGTALGDVLDRPLYGGHQPFQWSPQVWSQKFKQYMAFESDGSFHFRDLREGHTPSWGRGGWEHFLPQDGVSRVKVWGYRYDFVPFNPGLPITPPRPQYFEAEIALDAFQIQPNALLDAIPTRLRPDDFVPCSTFVPVVEALVYQTPDNFMGRTLYPYCMPCLLREATTRALARAQHALDSLFPEKRVSFQIWDAYRPYDVQKEMWAHTPDTNYVANPYTGGSSHNKGLAIDLTLLTVQEGQFMLLDMGTKFDDFSKKAHHGYKRLPKEVLANRALLKAAMQAAGFVALPTEWWHYRLPLDLPIADLKFECDY
jgi:zinc D-Ala-D-Ala dipeptidase